MREDEDKEKKEGREEEDEGKKRKTNSRVGVVGDETTFEDKVADLPVSTTVALLLQEALLDGEGTSTDLLAVGVFVGSRGRGAGLSVGRRGLEDSVGRERAGIIVVFFVLLFRTDLDVVAGKVADDSVDLSFPPAVVVAAKDSDDVALVEAQVRLALALKRPEGHDLGAVDLDLLIVVVVLDVLFLNRGSSSSSSGGRRGKGKRGGNAIAEGLDSCRRVGVVAHGLFLADDLHDRASSSVGHAGGHVGSVFSSILVRCTGQRFLCSLRSPSHSCCSCCVCCVGLFCLLCGCVVVLI